MRLHTALHRLSCVVVAAGGNIEPGKRSAGAATAHAAWIRAFLRHVAAQHVPVDFISTTIRQCDGSVQMLSYWTFSDVFEEDGPNHGPFTGGFGLRAYGGINKPGYYDFELLRQLGHARLANAAHNLIVTRTRGGGLAIALWNLDDPGAPGKPESVDLKITGVPADAAVAIERVDHNHSDVLPVYRAMGSPRYPTPQQVAQMNAATALPPPRIEHLRGGNLAITVQPDALFLLKVGGNVS